ncbi:hypothetical protein CHS0354_010479 [Potamilus streckersoni]|uniref:Uncharacterized protein n=1 Tax=Potamilus streckersoni TaxID=2493646 RepID=A0AAE0VHB7_9BIVA|nr:hypothetical protein CHS0354_010479 [Potamilus streckersoni]
MHVLIQNIYCGNHTSDVADDRCRPVGCPAIFLAQLQSVPDIFVQDLYLWIIHSNSEISYTIGTETSLSAARAHTIITANLPLPSQDWTIDITVHDYNLSLEGSAYSRVLSGERDNLTRRGSGHDRIGHRTATNNMASTFFVDYQLISVVIALILYQR